MFYNWRKEAVDALTVKRSQIHIIREDLQNAKLYANNVEVAIISALDFILKDEDTKIFKQIKDIQEVEVNL